MKKPPQALSAGNINGLFPLAKRRITPVEWIRFCDRCQKDVTVIAEFDCSAGLCGRCTGCGLEFVAAFHRMTEC